MRAQALEKERGARAARRTANVAAGVLYAAAALFIYAGFLFEESQEPLLFGYSARYLAFLLGLLVALAVPPILWNVARRFGARTVARSLAPTAALLALAYFALGTRYYATQTHLFDPFLQVHPGRMDPALMALSDAEFRVLAVGGSTTMNPQLDASQRYPAVMQRLLRDRHPEQEIRVYNAGASWWTTAHTTIDYVTHGRDFRPEVVVVMHAINDLVRSFSPEDYAIGEYNVRWSHFYGPAILGARPPSFPGHLSRNLLSGLAYHWYVPQRLIEVDFPPERYRSLPQFERNLRTLVHYVRSDGAVPILMTEPTLLDRRMGKRERAILMFGRTFCSQRRDWLRTEFASSASLARAMDDFNGAVRRVAQEEGVRLVDLAARIPRTLDYFRDDVHYTPRAAAEVAEHAADAVTDLIGARSPGVRHR